MEEEPCQFSKYGFCKFKDSCKRKHYNEDCKDSSNCQNIKTCNKRHPKPCKRFGSGRCRFQSECAYNHQNVPETKSKCELTEKVEILEKIVWEITLKFIKVDQELKNIKEEVKLQDQTIVKGNEIIAEQEPTKSDMHDMCVTSTVEDKSEEVELSEVENKTDSKKTEGSKSEARYNLLKCTKCEYQCKKDTTLRKHINTKHDDNIGNKRHLQFDKTKELQNHISEKHGETVKDTVEKETMEKVEQANFYDSRCSKCGYILFSKENNEDHVKAKLICKLCPILNQREQNIK